MNKTVLQIPMATSLRKSAENTAREEGFSSLQELVRLFLQKYAKNQLSVTFEKTIQLSPSAVIKYNKLINEINQGKNTIETNNLNDFFRKLNE